MNEYIAQKMKRYLWFFRKKTAACLQRYIQIKKVEEGRINSGFCLPAGISSRKSVFVTEENS